MRTPTTTNVRLIKASADGGRTAGEECTDYLLVPPEHDKPPARACPVKLKVLHIRVPSMLGFQITDR